MRSTACCRSRPAVRGSCAWRPGAGGTRRWRDRRSPHRPPLARLYRTRPLSRAYASQADLYPLADYGSMPWRTRSARTLKPYLASLKAGPSVLASRRHVMRERPLEPSWKPTFCLVRPCHYETSECAQVTEVTPFRHLSTALQRDPPRIVCRKHLRFPSSRSYWQ